MIISRKEAKAQGLIRFYTGEPCNSGHIATRLVSNGSCDACMAEWRANNAKHTKAYAAKQHKEKYLDPDHRAKMCAKANAWYAANRERAKATVRAYHAANRDKCLAKIKAYHAANPEVNRAATRKYRAIHADRNRLSKAIYRNANRERVCLWQRIRRARKRQAGGFHSAEDIHRIYQAQNGKCALCRSEVCQKYHVDHIQPVSKGGSNWPSNLQILCPSCNSSKGARDPIEHARTLGLLL